MFNSSVLDLAIWLSFTYFICSLIISAIGEAVAGAFRLRPGTLKAALEGLSFSPDWPAFVRDTLIKSPHLEALMEKPGKYPSYIGSENFVLAIVQQLGASKYNPADLAAAINGANVPAGFKQVLSDIAAKCQYNIDEFEKELKTFYNNAMDRAGGWYKRKIRLILLIIAILLAFLINLDTIRLASGYTPGYTGWDDFDHQWDGNNGANFFIKLPGILISAFALQLGSNFWFGLLTKAANLRASGKKPNNSKN